MPLYEYECPRTGNRFEVIQKFSDEPVKRCPECDQHPECLGEAKKILSAPAIQFKGAGWYVNDYGKGGEKKPTATAEASESKPDSKSESKSDSKSETKSDSKSESKSESKSKDSKPAAKSD